MSGVYVICVYVISVVCICMWYVVCMAAPAYAQYFFSPLRLYEKHDALVSVQRL